MIIFQQNQIKEISEVIINGEIVALPTDTIYGLACKFNDDKAINKIYQIKKRNYNKPLSVLVGSWEQAKIIGVISEELQSFLLKNFNVGKVTVIVLKQSSLNTQYWINKKTIAIRVSASHFIQELTKLTGPLVATSCNLSNQQPITNYHDINFPTLNYKVAGEILDNKPSTIFDSFNDKIIR
ncbi:L-threonylcarbamoyladenylate synthase [Spiroplasma endosymbiont of Polydrusus pterygomalis]|uniref:L-threonylcarbamoyladenylate synthase n=1 Tax=Spiroplasma endosymbiont of Polydrusus pterygomalis TaxID=3139327 RepID=UPI003CCA9E1B